MRASPHFSHTLGKVLQSVFRGCKKVRSDIVLETRPTRLFYKIEEQSVGIFRKVCEKSRLIPIFGYFQRQDAENCGDAMIFFFPCVSAVLSVSALKINDRKFSLRRGCLTRSLCSSRPAGVAAWHGHRPPLIAPGGDEDGVTDCPNSPRVCKKCGL